MDAYEHIERARYQLSIVERYYDNGRDALGAVRALGNVNEALQELVMGPVQAAFDQGATKKAIALGLGVPASTLRGMTKTAKPKNDGPEALKELLRFEQ